MKAMPILFRVRTVQPENANSSIVEGVVLRSPATNDGEVGRTYRLRLENEASRVFQKGDVIKILLYYDRLPETAEEYVTFTPIGMRIEVMHEGEDVWNLVAINMKE